MSKVGENVQVIWGASFDDELGDKVKITLIATGFDVSDIPGMPTTVAKTHQKPQMSAEAAKFFDNTPKQEVIVDQRQNNLFEEKDIENKQPDLTKTIEEYYVKSLKPEPTNTHVPEPELPIFSLDELENDTKLKDVENIPAWKRRFMK